MQPDLFPALKVALPRPVEPIIRDAVTEDGKRWTMRRAWGAGGCLGVVMFNPSDADGSRDDPTTWEVMKHACRLGFGSAVIGNLLPWTCSTPTWPIQIAKDPRSRETLVRNMHIVGDALKPCEKILFAWGNEAARLGPTFVQEFVDVVVWRLIEGCPDEPGPQIVFYCLGTTASGAPKHPLARGKHRIPADQKLVPWKP